MPRVYPMPHFLQPVNGGALHKQSVFGCSTTRIDTATESHTPTMDLKHVVAARLRELMDMRPDLDTQKKIAAATALSQSSIGRVLNAEVETNLGVLQSIARAFGVSPTYLLEASPSAPAVESIGTALQHIAQALQGLTEPKRRLIAQAATAMMIGGGSQDDAEAIDALAASLYAPTVRLGLDAMSADEAMQAAIKVERERPHTRPTEFVSMLITAHRLEGGHRTAQAPVQTLIP